MNWTMFLGISAPYSRQELYELWCNFREDPHADQMLADFMGQTRAAGADLIDQFECRFRREHCYEKEGRNY